MELTTVQTVRIDTESTAGALRETTAQRSYASLGFFLSSVLHVSVPDEVTKALQGLGLRRLALVTAGTALWLTLHKVRLVDFTEHDAIRWLFPEVKRG